MAKVPILDHGTLSFTIEGRVLRELGERLVRQPEVALVELVKNSYDADATECVVKYEAKRHITISDDGIGMTLGRFTNGWMKIGTRAKEIASSSSRFGRSITGEKGIGRFAVRFLGRQLKLVTVADDKERGRRTRLIAEFDWPEFDRHEDIGTVKVPFQLEAADADTPTGTTLTISDLRPEAEKINLQAVRTGSIGVLTPLRSLFRDAGEDEDAKPRRRKSDPGFLLKIDAGDGDDDGDVAAAILDQFTLRAVLVVENNSIDLRVYRRGVRRPYVKVIDTYPNEIKNLYADIRFFPRRAGSFANMPVDGRKASAWIVANSGVAVFDRKFRVQPYGTPSDDWLNLQADNARNRRDPRSRIAEKNFKMSKQEWAATSENWMLRLPQSAQLIGLCEVEGKRADSRVRTEQEGLVASADREGFVENEAFKQLQDLVRGAVEAIAYADRRVQLEDAQAQHDALVKSVQEKTNEAIHEVRANPNISAPDKRKIVAALVETQDLAQKQDASSKQREQQLEVMSLLGVVAGFMTHEFGVALAELQKAHKDLLALARTQPKFAAVAATFAGHIEQLKGFVTYSTGYIEGSRNTPVEPYAIRPRLRTVEKYFGTYAAQRGIEIEITADAALKGPLVPVSLYNGIALNLYTNALKAVTAKLGDESGKIAFRAWNEGKWHFLEVSDTGVGIPTALHDRVFDPLFTTTQSQDDPLGSGMGLGLALVRRGVEAFKGRIEFVDPPPNFSTCIQVRFPIDPDAHRG